MIKTFRKCFTAKAIYTKSGFQKCWHEHEKFNKNLAKVLAILFKLYHGDVAKKQFVTAYKEIVDTIIGEPKSAEHYLRAVYRSNFRSAKAEKQKREWVKLLPLDITLYSESDIFTADATNSLKTIITRTAAQVLSGYLGSRKEWKTQIDDRKKLRTKFEQENPDFLKIYPLFVNFRQTKGKIEGGRNRWLLYYKWLVETPELAIWRNKETKINLDKINFEAKRFPKKRFWKQNPELSALDSLYQQYRKLIKPSRPNTFTLPHPSKHPLWMIWYATADPNFNIVSKDTISLPINGKLYKFKVLKDNRIELNSSCQFVHNNIQYKIKSLNLIILGKSLRLVFNCEFKKEFVNAKMEKGIPYLSDNEFNICAVDLGLRHAGCAVAVRSINSQIEFLKSRFIDTFNPKILKHELDLFRKQKETYTRGIKGNNKELRKHIRNMSIDFAKKTAREIIDFAKENNSKILLAEDLFTLIPISENHRYFNRKLRRFVHGKIRDYLQKFANTEGIWYTEPSPKGTSQICSKCATFGRRFSIKGKKLIFQTCGKLFGCPNCDNIINSDLNAAINLIKSYLTKKAWLNKMPKDEDRPAAKIAVQELLKLPLRAKLNCVS